MGTVNNSLLSIVNSISSYINGKPADTISRPFKQEIINVVNAAENSVVIDKPQYDFLRKTAIINAYELSSGYTQNFLGNTQGTEVAGQTLPTTSNSVPWCVAESFTQPQNNPGEIASVAFRINPIIAGFGALNGTLQAQIVGVTGKENQAVQTSNPQFLPGIPDMTNVLGISTPISIINNVYQGAVYGNPAAITLANNVKASLAVTFPDPIVINANQTYFVVLQWIPNGYNAATLSFTEYNQVGVNACYGAFTTGNPDNPPVLYTTGSFNIQLTVNNAVYITKGIELPVDCRMAVRIGNPAVQAMFLPIGTDAMMYRQYAAPIGTFFVQGTDQVTGCQLVTLNTIVEIPTITQPVNYDINPGPVAQYFCDYIALGGQLELDTDQSVIPPAYRDVLIYKSLMLLYATNSGIALNLATIEAEYERYLEKMNENTLPQHSISVGVFTGRYTGSLAATRDNTMATSLLQYAWPNAWQQTFSSAFNVGPFGGIV